MHLSTPRSRALFVFALIASATGCASILGDFEVKDTPPGGGEGGADATTSDAPSDAPSDTATTDASEAGDAGCRIPAGGTHLDDAVQVSAGSSHTCAIRQDGSVWCWGDNSFGQLGVPQATTLQAKKPVKVEFPASLQNARITKIVLGEQNTFATDDKLRLWAWGNNEAGTLGDGTKDNTPHPQPQVVRIGSGAGASPLLVRDFAVEWYSTCAIATTSDVYCWGQNGFAQLGPNAPAGDSNVPVKAFASVGAATPNAFIASGRGGLATCYTDGNGPGLRCWGALFSGLLLNNNDTAPGGGVNYNVQTAFTAAGATQPMKEVSYGTNFGCARDSNRKIYCWGTNNSSGQHGTAAPAAGVAQLVDGPAYVSLSVGYVYLCAIDDQQRVRCRGSNVQGQLGRDTSVAGSNQTMQPVRTASGELTDAVSVSSGYFHACAIQKGACGPQGPGTVHCWGKGDLGQIGDGSGTDSAVAVPVAAP